MVTTVPTTPLVCAIQKTSQQMTPKDVQTELTKYLAGMLKVFSLVETQQA